MKVAILAFTMQGKNTGIRIAKTLECYEVGLFMPEKFSSAEVKKIERPLKEFVGRLFRKCDALIFVSATGIAVRAISGHIRDKTTDPAVVVVDEGGKHAISLLSGHTGGANDLARLVAKGIGAQAIITTASDVQGKACVETLAKKFNLQIEDYGDVKGVNAAIVNRDRVCIFSDIDMNMDFSDNISIHKLGEIEQKKCDALIIVTNRVINHPKKPCVILRPKNLLVGIGAKKGIDKGRVLEAIEYAFERAGLSTKGIKALATVDHKAREDGIIEASRKLGVPLKILDSEEVREIENRFEVSTSALKAIGLRAVCEPAAVLAGRNAGLLQKKIRKGGVTVAIAEEGTE